MKFAFAVPVLFCAVVGAVSPFSSVSYNKPFSVNATGSDSCPGAGYTCPQALDAFNCMGNYINANPGSSFPSADNCNSIMSCCQWIESSNPMSISCTKDGSKVDFQCGALPSSRRRRSSSSRRRRSSSADDDGGAAEGTCEAVCYVATLGAFQGCNALQQCFVSGSQCGCKLKTIVIVGIVALALLLICGCCKSKKKSSSLSKPLL